MPKLNLDPQKKRILTGVGVVVLLLLGYFIFEELFYVSTDNALVQAHTTLLSSKVTGLISSVSVDENQKVKAGQVLAKIDDRDYTNTLHQVESELQALQAQAKDAETNYRRNAELLKKGALSRQQFDTSEAAWHGLNRKLSAVQAQVDQAKLNLSYTELKAPTDGIVARRAAEPGMLAAVGQPLFGFVEAKERWVVANFKETELKSIKVGKKAILKVDAISGNRYEGEVESLSPSTGATFSLLPPDNATGNFTKVVQRVPVKIRFKSLSEKDVDLLQAGLSVIVWIPVF